MKDQLTRVASASCQVSIRGTSELSAEYQRNIRVVSSVSEEHRLIRLRAGKHQLCISQVSLAQSAANHQPRLSIHKGGVDSPSRTPHPSGERSPICQRASRRTRSNLAGRWFEVVRVRVLRPVAERPPSPPRIRFLCRAEGYVEQSRCAAEAPRAHNVEIRAGP